MDSREVLKEAVQRPLESAALVLKDIDAQALNAMPGGTGNSIAWLLWHAGRQMDMQVVDLSGGRTVWESGGWADHLGIDRGADEIGFGDSPEAVAALEVKDPDALERHLRACVAAFTTYVDGLSEDDLAEVIDESYDPPVTRGARLVSIIEDATVHVGQAAYARGLVDGWSLGV